MTLSNNHPAVRYYVLLLKIAGNQKYEITYKVQRITNLCQFIRALIFRTIIVLLFGAVFLMFASTFAFIAYKSPTEFITGIAIISGALSTAFALIFAIFKIVLWHKQRQPTPDGIIVTYLKAVKRGICPLLKIEAP